MKPDPSRTCTAFVGHTKVADGDVANVALVLKSKLTSSPDLTFLVFDDLNSHQVELDLRGSTDDVRLRYIAEGQQENATEEVPKVRGRPKLGVVAKEITLLPRHWEWLAVQPGGASATLRRLIDKSRKDSKGSDQKRLAQDVTYKFMSVMAGNLPHYEDALRALYAGNGEDFSARIVDWPADIAAHIKKLSEHAF